MLYDLFISHASEDKSSLVRALARRLVEAHLTVWYDEYTLRPGDSLRRSIDKGLSESRFGVVVLSEAFFAKNWPQYELDGLVMRENIDGDSAILPIWHGVDAKAVARYSLPLANRVAISSDRGMDAVIDGLLSVIRPRPSPLVIARDELVAWGVVDPPIVTDEYWLDVVEASNRVSGAGPVIERDSIWGRWSFPLPSLDGSPEARGLRLAWSALQLRWIKDADFTPVDLTSKPMVVHGLLDRHPALVEVCHEFPKLLAEYAPQLTIPGNGGAFEAQFAEEYEQSKSEHMRRGSANTCDEEWLLRDPEFGKYDGYSVAYHYFSGGMFGPQVRLHDEADYLFWLFSSESEWLPSRIREALRSGMSAGPNLWLWHGTPNSMAATNGSQHRGALSREFLRRLETRATDILWTTEVWLDIVDRAQEACDSINLPETGQGLATTFREYGVLKRAIAAERDRSRARRAY